MNRIPWWLGALLAVALIGIGGWLTLRPMASLAALLLLIVLGLLVAGLVELLAPADDEDGTEDQPLRRRLHLIKGSAYILGAIAVVAFTGLGVRVVIIAVGVALIVGGVLDLLEARESRGVARWNAALGGVASGSFGALALLWPDVSVILIGVFFGIRLILLGGRLLGRSLARARGRDGIRRGAPPTSGWRSWLRLAGNALAVLLAVALVLTSFVVRRGAPEPDEFYTAPADVPAEPGRLLRAEPYTREIPAGASAWRILYTTTRDEGQPAVASGLVVVPTEQARDRIPVIAWAHGTTGAAPGCAPTVIDPFEAGAFFTIDRVLESGWAFVATDYVGLGTESPHPYLIGQGEGRSVLDSVRAARELTEIDLGEQTVVWGHSQGGHAALWTGMLAPDYAPDLQIEGVAALAPASNLPGLIDNLGDVTGGELFASFVIDSYAAIYDDVTYDEYVRPGAQPIVRQMSQRCLADIRSTLVSVGTIMALDRTMWDGDPNRGALAQRLEENTPSGPIEAPLLIGQGGADQLVVPSAQDAFVDARCADGQQVDYRVYEGRDHVPLVEPDSPAIPELLEWTQARLAGEAPLDSCG